MRLVQRPVAHVLIGMSLLWLTACGNMIGPVQESFAQSIPTQSESGDVVEDIERPAGWSVATHGKSAEPDFETVFPQDAVNEIHVTIDAHVWQEMLDDLGQLYGGNRTARRPGESSTSANPMWAPVTISFEGKVWTQVGMRFKGNSTLSNAWRSGTLKLPFKLDFDQFEDDYPETEDQRFYGFKQLTFASNAMDSSLLREKVTADIFREAGVPAAHTAFYAVFVDHGDGPLYFGLYTMVEVVDDTVIETQFEDDSGNVYKPDGQGATFAQGTFSESDFDKETNAGDEDWDDILALFDVLHSDLRASEPARWRQELETIFDVDIFLRWLATNTVVGNWDTYGNMSHNYYLYNDPTTGRLTWIPWDNNEALEQSHGGGADGRGGNRPGGRSGQSLDQASVSDKWPLIRYLMDDDVYQTRYHEYLEEVIQGPFEPDEMAETLQAYHDLIQPYVTGKNGEVSGYTFVNNDSAFEQSVDELITYVGERYDAVETYLAGRR